MMIFMISLLTTLISLPMYIHFLQKLNKVQFNYKNDSIPFSLGLFIFTIEGFMTLLLNQKEFFYFGVFFLVSLIGTYDDFYGEKDVKGFKGHFTALRKGTITTGFIKAFGGSIAALYLALHFREDVIPFMTDFLLIVLMANILNLFDLRPGRSLKVYFFFFYY
ncbi:hypothetical protein [Tepidibacillus marianensis]|uniref:hypothetical protein n=1 Tax=Tepidibacillus marianensis TaxID=3131995 RepID=UPI0030CEF631